MQRWLFLGGRGGGVIDDTATRCGRRKCRAAVHQNPYCMRHFAAATAEKVNDEKAQRNGAVR